MFKRFYNTPAQPTSYVVRDAHTHQVLINSTHDKCLAYVNAFGMCYLDNA